MLVMNIEEVAKNRYKVFFDEEFAFMLYKGELSRYHIKVDAEVTLEEYCHIKEEVIQKRAKKRTLYLLDQMPRTEQQIRMKLKQNFYTDDVIEEAIAYAKSFGYIDDRNYVMLYVQDKLHTKSRKELYVLLLQKGIDKMVVQEVFDEIYEGQDELETIRTLMRKKKYEIDTATEKETQKLYGYLLRKGFSYMDISRAIECNHS